ncbi:hypothetical protein NS354_03270 [Leucobacter chromiiresistens]|uniref:Uncharacterized protein n=1 Tax=Leucobacter chromiiresistens TaxID=1079994 RepID=A0A147EQE5_9MICO|nr:hypothetical protein NS354_03270 [Leucobacter chromiiresistens]
MFDCASTAITVPAAPSTTTASAAVTPQTQAPRPRGSCSCDSCGPGAACASGCVTVVSSVRRRGGSAPLGFRSDFGPKGCRVSLAR